MSVGVIVLKAMAATCSVVMILSSAPAIRAIHKRHDTGDVALFPLVGLWINSCVAMLYGWATGSYFPIFATYSFGLIASMIYMCVYFRWTTDRPYAMKAIGAAFIALVVCTVYTILGMAGVTGQSTSQVSTVLGYALAVACALPYAGPFETIKTVIKTRSGASIPFVMCLAGATSNTIWTIEGLVTDDMFVLVISAVCAALALLQVALYLVFRPAHKASPASVVDNFTLCDQSILPVKVSSQKLQPTSTRPANMVNSPRCGDEEPPSSPVFVAICSP